MNPDFFDISDNDWEDCFKNFTFYDLKDKHNFKLYKRFGIDIIQCIDCGLDSLSDYKNPNQSCSERKMDSALK